jgi:hypothetical protein
MGRLVSELHSNTNDLSAPKAMTGPSLETLDLVRSLSPEDLKLFFEGLFSRMSLSAKETVMELIWTSMTVREQHLFDMPYPDHRLTHDEILENFAPSQLHVVPRRVIRGFQPRNNTIAPEVESSLGLTGLGVTRSRFPVMWPRVGLLRDVPSNPNIRNEETPIIDPENDQTARETRNVQQSGVSTSEDEIVNILMDVVRRAEQAASDTSSLHRSFGVWRNNLRGQNRENSENQESDENVTQSRRAISEPRSRP